MAASSGSSAAAAAFSAPFCDLLALLRRERLALHHGARRLWGSPVDGRRLPGQLPSAVRRALKAAEDGLASTAPRRPILLSC